jgi:hypothetical protein
MVFPLKEPPNIRKSLAAQLMVGKGKPCWQGSATFGGCALGGTSALIGGLKNVDKISLVCHHQGALLAAGVLESTAKPKLGLSVS